MNKRDVQESKDEDTTVDHFRDQARIHIGFLKSKSTNCIYLGNIKVRISSKLIRRPHTQSSGSNHRATGLDAKFKYFMIHLNSFRTIPKLQLVTKNPLLVFLGSFRSISSSNYAGTVLKHHDNLDRNMEAKHWELNSSQELTQLLNSELLGTMEQNLPQPFLMVLLSLSGRSRGSRGRHLVWQLRHSIRLG